MNFEQFLDNITPAVYQNLKRGVELGRWPDGNKLTPEQREACLRALIAYEYQHLPAERRSGHIPVQAHGHCGGAGEVAHSGGAEQPLNWRT